MTHAKSMNKPGDRTPQDHQSRMTGNKRPPREENKGD